jgi:hypothetical protein
LFSASQVKPISSGTALEAPTATISPTGSAICWALSGRGPSYSWRCFSGACS